MTSKRDLTKRVTALQTENRRLAAQVAGLTGTKAHYEEVIIPNILQMVFRLPEILAEMFDVTFEDPNPTSDMQGFYFASKYLLVQVTPYKHILQLMVGEGGTVWQTRFTFENGSMEFHSPEVIIAVKEQLGIASGDIARINAS